MKKPKFLMMHFLVWLVQMRRFLFISLLLIVIGVLWSKICLYICLALLGLCILLPLFNTIRFQRMTARMRDDDPEFGEMLNSIMDDPHAFISDRMEEQEKRMELHGEELSNLTDDELFDAVYFQNLKICEGAEDSEVDLFTGARKTVFVLSLFDAEVQNGGLCQFFVNSSREAAPYVSECLAAVGAEKHRALFDEFVQNNAIDLSDLSSFMIFWSRRSYIKQTKRYDFDAFDNQYYELPALQELITAYIRANIAEF